MNVAEARAGIEAILAAIDDDELPEFDRVESREGGDTIVWWGGEGRHLGSAKTGGERCPLSYRRSGSWAAIQGEMTYRTDLRYLKNGDKSDGIRLAAREDSNA